MSEQQKLEKSKKRTKICMITIMVLFIFIMLVVPLVSVMASALKEGFGFYLKAVSTEYVVSALKVTLIATIFAVVINTFFWNMCGMASDKIFLQGKTDTGYTYRYTIFYFTGYRWTCISYDLRKAWMVFTR